MSDNQVYILFTLFVLLQINSFRRRWNLPFLRGGEWFLGVPVGPDFYRGPGRRILRNYHLGLLIPYSLEAIGIVAILLYGEPPHLLYLAIAMVFLVVGGHTAVCRVTGRRARRLEVAGAGATVSSVMLPLKTRKLADYTSLKLEYPMALLNLAGLAYLARVYFAATWPHHFHDIFGRAILFIYLQIGLVLAKRALVAWRTVVPREGAEEYLEWREHNRRLWVDVCDSVRLLFSIEIAMCAVRFQVWDSERAGTLLLVASLVYYAFWAIWYARRRNAYLELARRTRPVKMPESLDDGLRPGGLVCYLPERPVLLVKGPAGYALNLASARTQVGALYFVGLVTVCAWLKLSH